MMCTAHTGRSRESTSFVASAADEWRAPSRRRWRALQRKTCYRRPEMRTVSEGDRVTLDELRRLAADRFGDLVKAVIDLERRIMIVDADLHADQEAELLAGGSRQ